MQSFAHVKEDKSLSDSLSKLDRSLLLCEFLECFVHQVLYARKVYDEALFETKRLYDMFVKKSLHPQLNSYIHDTIYSLKDALMQDTVESIEVVFLDPQRTVVESAVFKMKLDALWYNVSWVIWEDIQFSEARSDFSFDTPSVLKILPGRSALPSDCEFELSVQSRGTVPEMLKPIWYLHDFDQNCSLLTPLQSSSVGADWECGAYLWS